MVTARACKSPRRRFLLPTFCVCAARGMVDGAWERASVGEWACGRGVDVELGNEAAAVVSDVDKRCGEGTAVSRIFCTSDALFSLDTPCRPSWAKKCQYRHVRPRAPLEKNVGRGGGGG